jgi:hypothetical protein
MQRGRAPHRARQCPVSNPTHEGKTMKQLTITAIAAAISLAFSAAAMANTMSKSEYKAAKETIKAEYMSAKSACDPPYIP